VAAVLVAVLGTAGVAVAASPHSGIGRLVLGAIPGLGDSDSDAGNVRPNAASCNPAEARTSLCPHNKSFDVGRYVGHGDAAITSCAELASQADAQAVLRADPTDPNGLDTNRDGIACPELAEPRDTTPVAGVLQTFRCGPSDSRSARCPQASRPFDPEQILLSQSDEFDCKYFASQADAQAVLRFQPQDPDNLDGDRDGIACPSLGAPKDLEPVVRPPKS
jgi:hypothetical protein